MIEIDLLPERIRSDEAFRRNLVLGGALVVAVLVGVGMMALQKRTELKSVEDQIKAVQAEMQSPELQKIVQAVTEFTAQRQLLDTQQALVNQLRQKQVTLVKILDALPDVLPPRLWLTDCVTSVDKGKLKVALKGAAASGEAVAQLMSNLQNQGAFKSVSLDTPPAPSVAVGSPVVTFGISFEFEG
jgi:Tfp pilus assembly protein PilN